MFFTYSTAFALLSCISASRATPVNLDSSHSQAQKNGLIKREASEALMGGMNFADPSIIQVNDQSYAFATAGNGHHIQMASATDFRNSDSWKYINTDAYPTLAKWVDNDGIWAPDVVQYTDFDNSFGMYYAGPTKQNGKDTHCLGLARSGGVTGPYGDGSNEPWFVNQKMPGGCQEELGGQIDPSIFRDSDGSWYVVYKLDGPSTCPGPACHSTPIYLAKLGTNSEGKVDGYTLVNEAPWPLKLIDNNGADDEYNVEAPSLVMSDDGKTHFLFFSRGQYYDGSYKVSYTYSTNGIQGPWNNPRKDLLITGSRAANDKSKRDAKALVEPFVTVPVGEPLYAPGGADITLLGANMVFHSDYKNKNGGVRAMHVAQLKWLPHYEVGII